MENQREQNQREHKDIPPEVMEKAINFYTDPNRPPDKIHFLTTDVNDEWWYLDEKDIKAELFCRHRLFAKLVKKIIPEVS